MNPTDRFEREPFPERFCNLDRLLHAMEARGLDAVVASTPLNVFWLTGFNGIAHKSDEPRPYCVILARRAPDHPVMVLTDYYLNTLVGNPTWVKDVRSVRGVMTPIDLPAAARDVERFVPAAGRDLEWMRKAAGACALDVREACAGAFRDLGLSGGRVAFDELRFGRQLSFDGVEAADAYDPFMYARSVKTAHELKRLRRATALNEAAIERTVDAWERGMTWREFEHAYRLAAVDLGGFVRDPGPMVWGHLRGDDAIVLDHGRDDFVVEPGMHVLFDCHGTFDLYCWDGGKTWVVDGEPEGDAKRRAAGTMAAAEAVLEALRPGRRIRELQALGREAARKHAGAGADALIVFFHGLGLSHMDLEQVDAAGNPVGGDWTLEADMVVPIHVLWPGDEHARFWVEEVARVTPDGGEPFFSWGFAPMRT